MKTNDAINLSEQSLLYFLYFVLMGNGLFFGSLNCMDPISKWCTNVPISITYDNGQHFFICSSTLTANIVVIRGRKLCSARSIKMTMPFNQV